MAAKPTDLERANQLAIDLAAMTTRAEAAEATLATEQAALVTARASITSLGADVTSATNERNEARIALEASQAEVVTLKGAATTATRQAAGILATVGAEPLPVKPGAAAAAESLDDLMKQFAAETDSEKRHVLAGKIRKVQARPLNRV